MMLHLLIVDDEQLVIDSIKSKLKCRDTGVLKISEAFNFKQVKKMFLENFIDIMIYNIELPENSGLKLIWWVKSNYPETLCIAVTFN